MRQKGLEPSRLSASVPKTDVSAIPPQTHFTRYLKFSHKFFNKLLNVSLFLAYRTGLEPAFTSVTMTACLPLLHQTILTGDWTPKNAVSRLPRSVLCNLCPVCVSGRSRTCALEDMPHVLTDISTLESHQRFTTTDTDRR